MPTIRTKRRGKLPGTCHDTIDKLCDDMRGLAQIIHQAYHNSEFGFPPGDYMTWRECPKDVCASVRNRVAWAGREP